MSALPDGYIPDTALSSVNYGVEEVLSYLDNTNEYYASVALPNIERHFRALQDRSVNGSNNIEFLWMFFFKSLRRSCWEGLARTRKYGFRLSVG